MDGVIEAVHIYDEHYNPILSHTYAGRPLTATQLLPLYLEQQRQGKEESSIPNNALPSLVYLATTNPPTLVFGMVHASKLVFVATTTTELEPLLALEFLHRVADALESFLGSPLLASKIEEGGYDVAAQLLTEMCDAGLVGGTTEANALRDLVEVEGWLSMGRLLSSITLPKAAANTLAAAASAASTSTSPAPSFSSSSIQGPSLPWRRQNVRHTSNEMYADVVEALAVTLAPSGRPLAAFAQGSVVFTAKVSGVPDIVVSLTGPTGRHNLGNVLDLPVFHPCVRLARWKERPGELSFVPPDGRFLLASYEVDLLGGMDFSKNTSSNLKLPLQVDMRTNIGPVGADFEVRVHVNRSFGIGRPSSSSLSGRTHPGTPAAPLLEDVKIAVPLPAAVRNLLEIRPNRGDAVYNPGDRFLEWNIPAKDIASGTSYFGLRCTVVGQDASSSSPAAENDPLDDNYGFERGFKEYNYSEDYQEEEEEKEENKKKEKDKKTESPNEEDAADKSARKKQRNKLLMPSTATVSFSVKGWLASGLRVESIVLDTKRSRGLGEGVKPFKGVKYLTVSKGGIELRC